MKAHTLVNPVQIVNDIMNIFDKYRMPSGQIDQYDGVGRMLLKERINGLVMAGKPIDWYMLGFPFKSTNNRDKVIGTMPDLGEEVSLAHLGNFIDEINSVYDVGSTMHIMSDGYAFNDVLGVFDHTVMAYGEITQAMTRGKSIVIYTLAHFYPHAYRLAEAREKLMRDWGITDEQLDHRILTDPDVQILYRGMIHFMEGEVAMKGYDSRNQMHKAAKKLAREMMIRNEAYSGLVKHEFGQSAIRLSMHHSVNNGAKYSFSLYPNNTKAFTSPWHSALVVDSSGNMETVHKKVAIETGYDLMWRGGEPYYFIK